MKILASFLVVATHTVNLWALTPLPEILKNLQKSWDQVSTYQADFKQVVFSKRLGTRDETNGIISVMKPGKLRWENPGEKTLQILNGNKLTHVKTNRRRKTTTVDIYADVSKQVDTKALGFLSGTGQFKESYTAELITEGADKIELKLIPKTSQNESYVAEIDKKSYFLRALTTDTVDSRIRIDFTEMKVNPTFQSGLFEYKLGPKDIVHNNP